MHPDEERILIFASNRPGVVAKIVFSATAVATATAASASKNGGDVTVEARIHVLEVKQSHRGHDFGGLLFVEAMQALRGRYAGRTIKCHLDAEEDDNRYGRLIRFYSRLGCCVKPDSKIQYLNNDRETYRKVPMVIVLRPTQVPMRYPIAVCGLSSNCNFLPVNFHSEDGSDIAFWDHSSAPDAERRNQKLKWILIDDGNGQFHFRTTCGNYLFASSCGEVSIGQGNYGDPLVLRFSSASDSPDCNIVSDSDESDSSAQEYEVSSLSSMVALDEMWLVQTTCTTTGTTTTGAAESRCRYPEQRLFLSTDPCTRSLFLSPRPTAWKIDLKDRHLTCLANQSQCRVQHRNGWRYQTVPNVNAWRCKYLSFNLCTMSLKDALDLASSIPLVPFSADNTSSSRFISLRTFCYYAAEHFRKGGYPDWLCFVALVNELGRCVRVVEKREGIKGVESKTDDKDNFDWTAVCRSRIVGCSTLTRASLGGLHDEFSTLCPDEKDPLYSTELGMYEQGCGLSNVLMQWTGPEYIYWMLRHNGAMLPELALQIIRYFPLSGWHRRGEYSDLTNTLDESFRDTVSDFDEGRRSIRRECECEEGISEISDAECDRLWQSYYFNIAAKYSCDSDLSW